MKRPRLRDTRGCQNCRRRRKKCDGTKPVCEACARNRLLCVWGEKPAKLAASSAASSSNIVTRPLGADHDLSMLSADFCPPSAPCPAPTTNIMLFLEEVSTDTQVEANRLTQHMVISGVHNGWASLEYQQASTIAYVDHQLSIRGHRHAARMAFNWLFCMMQGASSSCFTFGTS